MWFVALLFTGCFLGCMNMEGNNNRKLFSIKKLFLDLRKHDVHHIGNLLSDDVTFIIAGTAGTVPLAGTYYGKEGIESYLKGFCSSLSNVQMIFLFNLVDGDYVNTHVQIIAKVRSSGKTFNMEFVYNWMLTEDGKIKFLHLYYDTNSWYNAFQTGGPDYVEDIKGDMDFDIKKVNFDTLQILKDTYDTFNRGDIPGVLDKLDDNFVFILKGDLSIPFEGKYYGKNGFLQWLNNLMGSARYLGLPINKYYVVQGNRVDAHVYEELMCLATGKIFRSEICQSWIISDDGKLLEFKSYNDQFEVVQAFKP
jgi:ketosteroid isomerase-like protein